MLKSKGIRKSIIQEMIGGDTHLARLCSTFLDSQAVKKGGKKVINCVSSVVAAAYAFKQYLNS